VADTIPADNHAIGDSGHVTDHNNMADVLSLFAQALAQLTSGEVSGTNTTNITQISNWVTNQQYANERLAVPGSDTVTQAALHNLATGTYQANDAQAGSFYEIEAWGNGTSGNPNTTLEFATSWSGGTASNFTFGTTAFGSTSETFRWWALSRVQCITTGSGGTWQSLTRASISQFGANISPGNNNMAEGVSCETSTTYTVDTTSTQTLALQAAWGSSSDGATLSTQWYIKRGIV
jgi:hypothetical protein